MASTRIYRTAGSPTLNTKHTISMWFKRTKITYGDCFLMDGYQDASNRFKLAFDFTEKHNNGLKDLKFFFKFRTFFLSFF